MGLNIFAEEDAYAIVGAMGTILFGALAVGAGVRAVQVCPTAGPGTLFGDRSHMRSWLFAAMTLYSLLETPRYVIILAEGGYASRPAYALHLLGSGVFFSVFSIVGIMWNGLVAAHRRELFTARGLGVVNVIFGALTIGAAVACLKSSDLQSFFHTPFFAVFTVFDSLKNLAFGHAIYFYGKQLLGVIDGYAITLGGDTDATLPLRRALRRLLGAMVVCIACFVLRVAMLVLKLLWLYDRIPLEDPFDTTWWWILNDFIPRAVPSITFLVLMNRRTADEMEARSSGQAPARKSPCCRIFGHAAAQAQALVRSGYDSDEEWDEEIEFYELEEPLLDEAAQEAAED